MEKYFEAKCLFWDHMAAQETKKRPILIVNGDDRFGERIIKRYGGKLEVRSFGMGLSNDYRATGFRSQLDGTDFQLEAKGRSFLVKLPFIGRFNVFNTLAGLGAADALGLNFREAVNNMKEAPQVPGRLEAIPFQGRFRVFVDYAHTPDALENVLATLKELQPRGVITVFGCGGNRDREKRRLMGEVANRLSTYSILTSDNPRKEDPMAILKDIEKAFREEGRHEVVEDREAAIRRAIMEIARPGDVVLIAGKGHETEQQFADHKIDFDDRKVAEWALAERNEGRGDDYT